MATDYPATPQCDKLNEVRNEARRQRPGWVER
jgi:hypothetical protein